MAEENLNTHQQLGALIEAVRGLKTSFDKVSSETSELKENSIKLTEIVDRMEPIVAAHEKIAGSIKEEYLPRLDEHHAYVEMLIRKAAFWQSVREHMIRKGAMLGALCFLAALLYIMGFESIAQKIVGQ